MRLRLLPILGIALFFVTTGIVAARIVRPWSYRELLEKSDLAVIAAPAATKDTTERIDLPGFASQHVIGVETRFIVSVVLKGDKTLADLVLHHYRADQVMIPNGPTFISFAPAEGPTSIHRTYILFLIRESDGRYAPVVGQVDPGLAIKELK